MTRVLVTGATGMIGRAVCRELMCQGEQVVALSRDSYAARAVLDHGVEIYTWADPARQPPPAEALRGTEAVIHLLGEPVDQRWSEEAKARIRDSRVRGTHMLVRGLCRLGEAERPRVLISQSATGFYGPSDDRQLTESAPAGRDFLAGVVREWEAAAAGAGDSTRVVVARTGVVLSASGGALQKMLPFFRLGVGGPVGGGEQYFPWIHLSDVVGGLLFCREHSELEGPVNLTGPSPVTNAELSRALGRVLHRPAVLPVPARALRLLYGEMAHALIATGQRAVPERLLRAGYEFGHPSLEPALRDVLGR